MSDQEYMYRYDDYTSSVNPHLAAEGIIVVTKCEVYLRKYAISSHTKCGVHISLGCGSFKFINTNATKQWACASEQLARQSYLARKKRQVKILKHKLQCAEAFLALAESNTYPTPSEDMEWHIEGV